MGLHLGRALAGLVVLGLAWGQVIVATVGPVSIDKTTFDTQFKLFVRERLQQQGRPYSAETAASFDVLKGQFLEQLVRDQAILLAAQNAGFGAKDEVVSNAIEEIQNDRFGNQEEFEKALQEAGIADLAAFRGMVYEALTHNAYLESLQNKLSYSDPALRILYLLSRAQFAVPTHYCSAHILLPTEAQAKTVLARLGKGEDFAALAKTLSQDPGSKNQGGDLGCEPKGTFVEAFERALVALKPGALSQPVRTQYGFHVIKLIRVEPENTIPFEDAKDTIAKSLTNATLDKYLAHVVAKYPTQLFPERL
jgi:peptidyl-prolyl cis-trans isomerase C